MRSLSLSLRQQEYSERFTSSYSSSHTLSLSCSPVEADRRIHAIHSQLLPVPTEPQATPPPSVTGPLFSDIQREFKRKEMQEPGQQGFSASCDSKMVPTQVNYFRVVWCPPRPSFRTSCTFHSHAAFEPHFIKVVQMLLIYNCMFPLELQLLIY